MHSRLVAEGKVGSAMRSGANYSTWRVRAIAHFHNMIGILTESHRGPRPIEILGMNSIERAARIMGRSLRMNVDHTGRASFPGSAARTFKLLFNVLY